MSDLIIPSSLRRKILLDNLAKLDLQEGDIIIVRQLEDFKMFVDFIQKGIPISKHRNPVLCLEGGLERATREDLVAALDFLDNETRAEDYNDSVLATTKKLVQ